MDITGSGYGIVAGACRHGVELCRTLNYIEYLNQLGKYRCLKTDFDSWRIWKRKAIETKQSGKCTKIGYIKYVEDDFVKIEVLKLVTPKVPVFWMWSFVFLYSYKYFERNIFFSLQKISGVCSFKTSTVVIITTLRHLPEVHNPEDMRDLYSLLSVVRMEKFKGKIGCTSTLRTKIQYN